MMSKRANCPQLVWERRTETLAATLNGSRSQSTSAKPIKGRKSRMQHRGRSRMIQFCKLLPKRRIRISCPQKWVMRNRTQQRRRQRKDLPKETGLRLASSLNTKLSKIHNGKPHRQKQEHCVQTDEAPKNEGELSKDGVGNFNVKGKAIDGGNEVTPKAFEHKLLQVQTRTTGRGQIKSKLRHYQTTRIGKNSGTWTPKSWGIRKRP